MRSHISYPPLAASAAALLLLGHAGCEQTYLIDRAPLEQAALAQRRGRPADRIAVLAVPARGNSDIVPKGEPPVFVLASSLAMEESSSAPPEKDVAKAPNYQARRAVGITLLSIGLVHLALGATVIGLELKSACLNPHECFQGIIAGVYGGPFLLVGTPLTLTGVGLLGSAGGKQSEVPLGRPEIEYFSPRTSALSTNASTAGVALRF